MSFEVELSASTPAYGVDTEPDDSMAAFLSEPPPVPLLDDSHMLGLEFQHQPDIRSLLGSARGGSVYVSGFEEF